jgi:hypothetical protein
VVAGTKNSEAAETIVPHPEEPRLRGVSKDGRIGASWFETREDARLTMRNCYFGNFAFSA